MNGTLQTIRDESRWPPALAIFVVLVMLTVLPDHVHVLPAWVVRLVVIAILGSCLLSGSLKGTPCGSKSSAR